MRRWLPLVLLAASVPFSLAAHADDDLDDPLGAPAKRGTAVSVIAPPVVSPGQAFELQVVFDIPNGYHLYGPKAPGLGNPAPTTVVPQPVAGVTWGAPVYPKVHKGPFMDEILEIKLTEYFERVVVTVPGKVAADARYEDLLLTIKAAWGTCNDQSCLELKDIKRNPAVFKTKTRVVMTKPTLAVGAAKRGSEVVVRVTLDVPDGHHIYGPQASTSPTTLALAPVAGVTWSAPVWPAAKDGKYTGQVIVTVKGQVAAGARAGAHLVIAKLSWSTCDDQSCYEFVGGFALTGELKVE